jgi:hypothetical protein
VNPLVGFAVKREALRKNKEAGLPRVEWTDDKILKQYRFCNVRRSEDRVSKWLIENVLKEEWIKADLDGFILFTALCRWVNWPPTIKELLDRDIRPGGNRSFDWDQIGAAIDHRKQSGAKAWTGAYLIRAKPGYGKGKGHFIATEVIGSLGQVLPQVKEALKTNSRRAVWAVINDCMNWGPFLSGQVIADWGYTSLLKEATDTYTWAPQGPGSIRGLNRILGRPLKQRFSEEEFLFYLKALRKEVIEALGLEYEDLTLHDCQSLCCETDKFLRVRNGEGRPRSTYKPETAY